MAKKLDQAIIIDIESTCWPGLQAPPGQISEIIEIGICLVDLAKLTRHGKRSILVRPMRSKIGEFCTKLTGITPSMVARGVPLIEAIEILVNEYESEQRLFVSWGDYDRNQFRRNCDAYRIPYPFGPTHLNVKNMYSVSHGLSAELDLDAAMQREKLPLEGDLHRGVDDAWNTALIFCRLLEKQRSGGA